MSTDVVPWSGDDKSEMRWPNDHSGNATDWFEFSITGHTDTQGELLRVKINVSFLTSRWKCIFGQGCPGVLISGAMEDRGCCQIGVHMQHSADDYKRVQKYVAMLTEEDLDADRLALIRKAKGDKGWRYRDTDGEDGGSVLPGYDWHTRVVDGACVLANRSGGSTGKLGCSLHVLANRLGLHHSDTKPTICWQIPMAVSTEYYEELDQTSMTVDATPAHIWGHTDPTTVEGIGWWCMETPDAFVIGNKDSVSNYGDEGMVFRTNEVELRKMMGDHAYDEMCGYLMDIIRKGGRRAAMPGETINGGRPLIPIVVANRLQQWVDEETPEAEEILQRSLPYLETHVHTLQLTVKEDN